MNSYKLVTMLSSAAGEALLQQQGIEATSGVAHMAQTSAINASIQPSQDTQCCDIAGVHCWQGWQAAGSGAESSAAALCHQTTAGAAAVASEAAASDSLLQYCFMSQSLRRCHSSTHQKLCLELN
jgi:hypothetical protein